MYLHCLVKLENFITVAADFYSILHVKSHSSVLHCLPDFIVIRFRIELNSESDDYKIWKTVQQCSEEDA